MNVGMNINQDDILLFNDEQVRREWYNEERYFSVVDVVKILTWSQSEDKWWYRRKLKQRLSEEWSEIVTKCHKLKLLAPDGKRYPTDTANTKTLLRIIQSIPSPNAEPFKQRLASLWNERIEETNDPELWIVRARMRAIENYKKKGMTDSEIKRILSSIETRNDLTDEYQNRGIIGMEYGILTNLWYGIFGTNADGIRSKKWLWKHDNPRDHMNKTELLLTELTEETSKNLIQKQNAQGFNEIAPCVTKSVEIVKDTKDSIEKATWENVLTDFNRLTEKQKSLRAREKKALTKKK